MSKVKVKTLIGATVAILFFLTAIVAFLLYAFPEKVASAIGLGPYDGQRILTFCAAMVAVLFLVGWLVEKAFDFAGKSGLYFHWGANKNQAETPSLGRISGDEEDKDATFNAFSVIEHLSLRYDRRWKRKVRFLLIQGNDEHIEKVVPGLRRDRWQESDGVVLIHGGPAESAPDEAFLHQVCQLRPRRPLDGIVQVLNTRSLPTEPQRDACVRQRQKADKLLGWQAPVWLWLIDKAAGEQDGRELAPVGALFGPGATPEQAVASLDALVPRLRTAGMAHLLEDVRHDWLLNLSSRLHQELRTRLTLLFTGLMQGPAPYRLRGIMLSPALAWRGHCSACPPEQPRLAGAGGGQPSGRTAKAYL